MYLLFAVSSLRSLPYLSIGLFLLTSANLDLITRLSTKKFLHGGRTEGLATLFSGTEHAIIHMAGY